MNEGTSRGAIPAKVLVRLRATVIAELRQIAHALFSRSVGLPRWRSREPSVRSQVQRLIGSVRWSGAGGYRDLLR